MKIIKNNNNGTFEYPFPETGGITLHASRHLITTEPHENSIPIIFHMVEALCYETPFVIPEAFAMPDLGRAYISNWKRSKMNILDRIRHESVHFTANEEAHVGDQNHPEVNIGFGVWEKIKAAEIWNEKILLPLNARDFFKTGRAQIILLTGLPGMGKSELLLKLQRENPKDVVLLATTNPAANRLDCRTYFSHFEKKPIFIKKINEITGEEEDIAVFTECWKTDTIKRVSRNDKKFYFVDEASMVSYEFIEWFKVSHPNATLVLVGDNNQLPMVKEHEEQPDWHDIKYDIHIKLNKFYRFKDEKITALIDCLLNDDRNGVANLIKPRMVEREVALNLAQDRIFISWTNKARITANKKLIKNRGETWERQIGTRWMCNLYKTKNRHTFIDEKYLGLKHNEIYELTEYYVNEGEEKFRIWIKGDLMSERVLTLDQFKKNFVPGAALTAHKCQGQTLEAGNIVDLDDILKCRNPHTIYHELFVVGTRARSFNDIVWIKTETPINFINPRKSFKTSLNKEMDADEAFDYIDSLINELTATEKVSQKVLNPYSRATMRVKEKIGTLSSRKLEELTGVNYKKIQRLLKSGLTQEQIIKDYIPKKQATTWHLFKDKNGFPYRDKLAGQPVQESKKGTTRILGSTEDKDFHAAEYETINPVKDSWKNFSVQNTESFANFILECDDVSVEDQTELSRSLFEKGIANRVVYSGGKSIHTRITLNNAPKDWEAYKFVHKLLNEKYFEGMADKNVPLTTRKPNAIRTGNGKVQDLILINDKKINFDWETEWEQTKEIRELARQMASDCYTAVKEARPPKPGSNGERLVNGEELDRKEIWSAICSLKGSGWSRDAVEAVIRENVVNANGKNRLTEALNLLHGMDWNK